MAWETVGNGGKNYDDDEEVTFVPIKIGTKIEGTVEGFGNRKPNKFGDGEERTVFYRGADGVKYGATARKIVLERFDNAGLNKGDQFRLSVDEAGGKDGKRAYGQPTLQVNRGGDAPKAAPEVSDLPTDGSDEIPF